MTQESMCVYKTRASLHKRYIVLYVEYINPTKECRYLIIGEQKPLPEIISMIEHEGGTKILIVGCRSCVAVCLAGGEEEVLQLADRLREYSNSTSKGWEISTVTLQRQCEKEFDRGIAKLIENTDVILSLGCGVGAQVLGEVYPERIVLPGINTSSMGAPEGRGKWKERCVGCGDCTIQLSGGICPIARCSKMLQNGPCGGSQGGKCEVSPDRDCAWQLIYDRLRLKGRLDLLEIILPPKDWSKARDGGPRIVIKNTEAGR